MEQFDLIIIDSSVIGAFDSECPDCCRLALIPIQAEFYALESMGQHLNPTESSVKS